LLSHSSLDLAHGPHETVALVLQMDRVFEQFVRGALRAALGVPAASFPVGAAAPRVFLDRQASVALEPDLSLWVSGRCVFVGDVKYKRDFGGARNDDLYQLLAYATALGLPDATLVYAEGPASAARHDVHGTDITIYRHRL